jgi:DNA replication regulator DPB11
LCVSGIEDVNRRTAINRNVTQNGGKYVKNIERPVRVTHLLCSGNEETDKMHYARRFNERGEADIKLVWEEWFWDSLDFGGACVFFFQHYNISLIVTMSLARTI